jgi:hypothetical protein
MREMRPRHAHDGHEEEVAGINGTPHQPELGESLATPLSGDRGGRGHGADSPVEVVYVERAYARRSSVAWGDGL